MGAAKKGFHKERMRKIKQHEQRGDLSPLWRRAVKETTERKKEPES